MLVLVSHVALLAVEVGDEEEEPDGYEADTDITPSYRGMMDDDDMWSDDGKWAWSSLV
jgi:hypothetical protein